MEAVNTHNKNQRPKHAKQTIPSHRYHVVGNDFERLVHEPNDTGLQKYSFLHHWFEDKKVRFYALKIDLHLIYSA